MFNTKDYKLTRYVIILKKGGLEITLIYIELVLLVLISLISDIRTFKIKNIIVVFSLAAGFLTNLIISGLPGLTDFVLASVLPIPLLIIFFALRMLGAGDIKLFCAIGAIAGVRFILLAMAYSFIAGGVLAIIIMLVNKSFRQRGRYLYNYLRTCFLTRSLQPYTDFYNKNDRSVFRFSYAVTCGVLIEIFVKTFLHSV